MSDVKKIEGAAKKAERAAALATLAALAGKTFTTMSKNEQESFITALGQLLGVMDNIGQVK